MTIKDLQLLADCAALAPSVHNTQPWRLEMRGNALENRADRTRQLGYLDPTGRQMHISCGAATEFARLAGRALDRECRVQLLPEPNDADLVARLTLGARSPATDVDHALAAAIPVRYTDRGPFSDRKVPSQVLIDAQRRAAELGVWLRLLDHPNDHLIVNRILAAGEAAEAADPEYEEELGHWVTQSPRQEGVPLDAVAGLWPPDRVSELPLRDFTGHNRHPHPGAGSDEPPAVERDTVLLLGTPTDDADSWLRAGQALGWALLRCAVDNVSAQPLGQALDLAHVRAQLRRELGLVGQPQFLLRLGYGAGVPVTHRRATTSTH